MEKEKFWIGLGIRFQGYMQPVKLHLLLSLCTKAAET